MNALSPLWVPALLGGLTLAVLLRPVSIRYKALLLTIAAIPTGFGLCSLILFISLWIIPSHARSVSLTASIAASVILLVFSLRQNFRSKNLHSSAPLPPDPKISFQRFFEIAPPNKRQALILALQWICFLVFLSTLWTVIQFYILSVSTNITGGWDARYMWSLKAKFMFRSPEEWQSMFSPILSWSHPDYPLLWPGTLAWGWNWLGQESLLWPPWASLCFYVACAGILVWYLAGQVSSIAGWLGGSFFLTLTPPLFWSVHQYADLPLTFFITASALTLAAAFRTEQPRLFIISGLMAGLAAWTKNEGLLFALWIAVSLAALKTFERQNPVHIFSSLKNLLQGAVFPLACLFVFKIFLGKSGDYFGPGRSLQDYATLFLSGLKNGPPILQSFWNHLSTFPTWKGLWAFFALACIALPFKKVRTKDERLLLFFILLINLGYVLAFLTTPNDLEWHLKNALERLLIHTAPLALVFSFEILTFRQSTPHK